MTPPRKSPKPQATLAAKASAIAVTRGRRDASPRRRPAGSRGRAPPPRPCGRHARRGGRRPRGAARRGLGVEAAGPLLDEPEAEVDVAEQLALRRRPERGRPAELDACARRRGGAPPRAGGRRAGAGGAAPSRGRAWRRRRCARAGRRRTSGGRRVVAGSVRSRCRTRRLEDALDHAPQRRVRDLVGEEVEEAVELVGVAAHRRGERGGSVSARGLERADVELEPVAEALDAAEHANGVALVEARGRGARRRCQTRASIRPLGSTSSSAR